MISGLTFGTCYDGEVAESRWGGESGDLVVVWCLCLAPDESEAEVGTGRSGGRSDIRRFTYAWGEHPRWLCFVPLGLAQPAGGLTKGAASFVLGRSRHIAARHE
jgi:hypothetical protein